MCLRSFTQLASNGMRGVSLATFADEKTPMKKVWCFPDHHLRASDSTEKSVTLEGRYSDPHRAFSSFRLTMATVQRHVKPRDQLGMVVSYKKIRNCTYLTQLPNVHLNLSVLKPVSFGVSLKIRQVYMVSTHTVKKTIIFYKLTCGSSKDLSELWYA